MKRRLNSQISAAYLASLGFGLAAGLALPLPALAASVALATAPLSTTSTVTIRPNLLLVLDNSGSMDWDHMPDDSSDGGSAVTFSYGFYGLRSYQCNMVYYDPAYTYSPPVHADGTSYSNASFTGAWTDGYNTGAGTVNLSTSFKASQSLNGDTGGQPAYYYKYSGAQTTALQKNYNSTTNTFYSECHDSTGANYTAAPATGVGGVFTKVAVTSTSGPGSTDERTNFANWYSYYRSRLLMMKTATGRAFNNIDDKYRVGLMKISSSSTPTVYVDTFWDNSDTTLGPVSTQRTTWYNALYNTSTSGSTPLRTALSDAGRYFAHKLSGADPMQYSCQQNFALMSTDGYWNAGNGYQLDGSTPVGNQDGTAGRPMYDGAQSGTTVTTTYTRNSYSTSSSGLGNDAICPKVSGVRGKRLISQPQIQSCSVTAGVSTCTAWSSNGSQVYVSPYTSSTSTCAQNLSTPNPSTSNPVVSGTPVTTAGSVGGSSDSLSDVAMYYYQTDLRTPTLNNCTGAPVPPAATGNTLCSTPANPSDPDPYNNVYTSSTDNNVQQHMNTFTLGLGASGWMTYSSSYLNDTSGDYVAVKLGSTANSAASPPICSWQADGTVCNWSLPGMSGSNGLIANVDDLWHAAVDGRGAYFSATNPATLSAGLSNALTSINAKRGSSAAAATSTLNPVAGNNFSYVASYTTNKWTGNLESRGINVDTGVISQNATWCVENVAAQSCAAPGTVVAETTGSTTIYNCVTPNSVICPGGVMSGTDCKVPVATSCTGTMNALVSDTSDSRTIYTAPAGSLTPLTGQNLVPFDSSYVTANPTNFAAAHINTLSQWVTLTAAQQTAAAGTNLINFLRGQHGHEFNRSTVAAVDQLYRTRDAVLGDALESQPAYISNPVFSYPYPGYSAYVTAQANRAGTVYMGTNDGMMHAFAADTGVERWTYVPSMVIPNMWKLADISYATMHANFVNGSPITSDIYCPGNCGGVHDAVPGASASWRTILVAGLNGGGRGYYALDITDPVTPILLWEFTPATDSALGYSYGQPIITRKADGTWVVLVTSGYDNGTLSSNPLVNNSPTGDGIGYLYVLDATAGTIISKISTGVGSAATPSGLAKIAAWNDAPGGNQAGYVYGGDLLGNVWRFDINSTATAAVGKGSVMQFATLFSNAAGTLPQPVTTTPVLGSTTSGARIIFVGTGKYLESADRSTTQTQTQYAIVDNNATTTLVNPRTSLIQQTLTTTGATRTVSNNAVNLSTDRGWYVDFPVSGERVNIDSKLVQGTLLVPTIVPSGTDCSPAGYGWLNYFSFLTGGAVDTTTNLASVKYDSAIVGINVIYVQNAPLVEVVTSNNPTPTLDNSVPFVPTSPTFQGKRMMWRELLQ